MRGQRTMTTRARNFMRANKESAVVYGSVIDVAGTTGRGCYYRLENGKTFRLTRNDCRAVGHPRWAHA